MDKKYILSSLGICLLMLLGIFSIFLYEELDLYTNFLFIICIVLFAVICFCILSFFSRKIYIFNMGIFVMFLCNVILIYNIWDIENKYSYISNIVTKKYSYETYEVYVQKKNAGYSNISKLSNRRIGLLKDNEEYVISYMRKVVDINFIVYDSIEEMEEAISQGEIQCFILPNGYLDNSDLEITSRVKPIYQSKIKKNI